MGVGAGENFHLTLLFFTGRVLVHPIRIWPIAIPTVELDEDIMCVKRVEMSWYDSDLSSNYEGIYRGTGSSAVRPSVIGPLPHGPTGTHGPHARNPQQSAMQQSNPAHL
jgi:hypothetical protein